MEAGGRKFIILESIDHFTLMTIPFFLLKQKDFPAWMGSKWDQNNEIFWFPPSPLSPGVDLADQHLLSSWSAPWKPQDGPANVTEGPFVQSEDPSSRSYPTAQKGGLRTQGGLTAKSSSNVLYQCIL